MVHLRNLVGLAGVGGVVIGLTGHTLHSVLQHRVSDSPVFLEAMKLINNHTAAISILGKPVTSDKINVSNKNNILSLRLSSLEIPVKGPKNKGILYIWADRLTDKDQWNLYRIELEILDSAGGKLSLVNKEPILDTV